MCQNDLFWPNRSAFGTTRNFCAKNIKNAKNANIGQINQLTLFNFLKSIPYSTSNHPILHRCMKGIEITSFSSIPSQHNEHFTPKIIFNALKSFQICEKGNLIIFHQFEDY